MTRFFQRTVFVLSLAIFVALGSGFILGEFGLLGVHAGQQDGSYRQINVYGSVLRKIQTDYVTEPKMDNVTAGALHGLLESLDADSSYLSPTEYKIYKERSDADKTQVGITVSKRYGYAVIVGVVPGSPADKQKLSSGDVIESIDGQSTRELSLAVIRLLLEGKPETALTLSAVLPGKSEPEKITMVRAIVAEPTLGEQQFENSSILYLKPGELTPARVNDVAAKLRTDGKGRKIVLDLRDCTAGDPRQGVALANLFIKQGTLATLEGQKYPRQTLAADPGKFLTSAPLAVLVNRGTYGAAEIAAAAIGDTSRGDVVGERTFGEGSVQKTFDLPDGSALFLTVAKYSGPAGKKIQDEAVTPNVVVTSVSDEDEVETNLPPAKDDILKKAIELLKAKNS